MTDHLRGSDPERPPICHLNIRARRGDTAPMTFPEIDRITMDPDVMGGKPCIRGMRVTVGTVTALIAAGSTVEETLRLYPYLDERNIRAAVAYAAWRAMERELPANPAGLRPDQ